ncbi:hypothetical protein BH11CYA1_BH11CYA1_13180 [soil metagenome]
MLPLSKSQFEFSRLTSLVLAVSISISSISISLAALYLAPASAAETASTTKDSLELKEYKKSKTIEINASQSKLFRIKDKIVRTSVGDVGIAEPVVVSENRIIVLGKNQGETTIQVWDDLGGEIHMTVIVNRALNRAKGRFANELDKKDVEAHLERPAKQQDDLLTVPGGEVVQILSNFKTGKTCKTIELIAHQSRTFRVSSTLAKVTVANTNISEPIVIEKNEFVLLGKLPGKTQLELQDKLGKTLAVDLVVDRHYGRLLNTVMIFTRFFSRGISPHKPNAVFEPVKVEPLELIEVTPGENITLKPNEQRIYNSKHNLVRMAVADPGKVELKLLTATKLALCANHPGRTTIFLWDDAGETKALELVVAGPAMPEQAAQEQEQTALHPEQAAPGPEENSRRKSQKVSPTTLHECEVWRGNRKDIASAAGGTDKDCTLYNSETAKNDSLIELNNLGVRAIVSSDFTKAIECFEKALNINPDYKNARANLAIAYNNLALSHQENPETAILHFQHSIYIDPTNKTTLGNLEGILRRLGKDPNSFVDRVRLGDEAIRRDDTIGGIVEYQAALRLNEDKTVRTKLVKATEMQKQSGKPAL